MPNEAIQYLCTPAGTTRVRPGLALQGRAGGSGQVRVRHHNHGTAPDGTHNIVQPYERAILYKDYQKPRRSHTVWTSILRQR